MDMEVLHNRKAHMDMEHTEESYITFSQRAFPNYLSNNDNGNINRSKQTKNQKIIKSNIKIKMPASTFAKKDCLQYRKFNRCAIISVSKSVCRREPKKNDLIC